MKSLHEEGGLASEKSLRDEFAGLALIGVLGQGDGATVKAAADFTGVSPTAVVAAMVYQIADAMLAARKEQR